MDAKIGPPGRQRSALIGKWVVAALLGAGGAVGCSAPGPGSPPPSPYPELTLPAAAPEAPIQVRFAGVSTLLFDDHDTRWMIDGFFSRPPFWQTALGKVGPNIRVIRKNLALLGWPRLAAVVPAHSHYDHAMDSPIVAMFTDAALVGSESTLNIGRGLGWEKVHQVDPDKPVRLGRWTLTFFPSRHGPTPALIAAKGSIGAPLEPPRHALDWREGHTWLILVEHDSGPCMLVSGTAGFPREAIKGRRADTVFLAVGMLGTESVSYREALWDNLVRGFGATRVVPIHWDNFWKPLDQPLVPLPAPLDRFDVTMTDYLKRAGEAGIELKMPPLFTPFEPVAQEAGKPGRRAPGCRADKAEAGLPPP